MAAQINEFEQFKTADDVAFSARELAVLNEIATVVSSATDIVDVYSSFVALVADVVAWDGIILGTPSSDGKHFEIKVREGIAIDGRNAGAVFEIADSLFEQVMTSRKSAMISVHDGETTEWALKIPGLRTPLLAGVRSWCVTPLISQGDFLGVIYVQSLNPDAFTSYDMKLLERIATFVASTLARFNAYDDLRRDALLSKSVLNIGQMLLGARDIGDVIDDLVAEMGSVIEVDRISIAVAQSEGETLVDRHIQGVPIPGYEIGRVFTLEALKANGLDVSSHGYILAGDVLANSDPVASPGLHANFKAGLRSAMFAGLQLQGRMIGSVAVKSLREGAYREADLVYLEQVADHIAASITRSLAYETEHHTVGRTDERMVVQQNEREFIEGIRAKERLLSSASHELRTPLTGILAFVDLLARNRGGNLDDKQLRYLSIVRRNAEDLSAKVVSLIDHAARDVGQLNIKLENFDLAPMLREAITDAKPNLAKLDQTIGVEVSDEIQLVADRRHLLVALGHLIENASNYTPEGSRIYVSGKVVGRTIDISVTDEGSGNSDSLPEDIFDPFERGERTGMAASPGVGLGLTYVRAVAIEHGGHAHYKQAPNGGAIFTISIPAR